MDAEVERRLNALTERLASFEGRSAVFTEHAQQNTRDLWEQVNEIKEQIMTLEAVRENQAMIIALGKETLGKVNALEKENAVIAGQRNVVIGFAGWIAAGVGAAAMFVVKEFVWPWFSSSFLR